MQSHLHNRRVYPERLVFAVPIKAISLKDISLHIVELIHAKGKKTFFYINAHCLTIATKDTVYKNILQSASFVYSGGFGPVLASRLLGETLPERTPTPDFIYSIFATAQKKGWSIFLLGGKAGVARSATEKLRKQFPKLGVIGFHDGYFSRSDEKSLIQNINKTKPTILLVGMGTPKQEKWIADNIDRIDAKVFWAVGALFDIMAGNQKRAPLWMRNVGLEWLYRFFQEPRRLWKRYTFGNMQFIFFILLELLHARYEKK